ncbi:hypothetical protein GH975_00065 [Litorivicinus lipolyticus]|uniref:LTXXQ motif family protein n=1 Tax=Litorivicinus lipolyticus TaxID=418701 RepID=A0A5Q2Q7U5_9GAMM|nr:Spy/CpxP family protein refolding chaperone [Litorivicinus lipolyticus]QGG79033.1 hypothetical protein GH975_00065 [Litorivicinus lipolyticus]
MKKIAMISALVVATATAGFAVADGRGDRMMKGLDLTDAQQTQMMELRDQQRATMQAMHAAFSANVRAILTPEQQVTFDERMQKRQAKMEKRDGKDGYGMKGDRS